MIKNKFNIKKLLNSKWTSVNPINQEKHFIISEMKFDHKKNVKLCLIEAVRSSRLKYINWLELKESDKWIQGWK